MRIFRLIAATIFVVAIAAVPTFAQQKQGAKPPATTPTPAAAPAQNTAANPVPAKIAFVNTEAFKVEKIGINRWIAAAKRLEGEFEVRGKELDALETRIQALGKEVQTLGNNPAVDRKSIIAKQDEIARLQREQKFKKDEGEALFKKRYEEVVGPVSQDIGKALDVFARQRGITLLLEYSSMRGSILSADISTDVTAAFVADYNSKNPETAPTTSPGR